MKDESTAHSPEDVIAIHRREQQWQIRSEAKALSPKGAIDYYPILGCEGSLANMRCKKIGPKYYKIGKKVLYRPEDLEAYLFRNPVLTIDSVPDRTA